MGLASAKDILTEIISKQDFGARTDGVVLHAWHAGITLGELLEQVERRYIVTALKENQGNQCQAARDMHMHRNTLSRKIQVLEITPQAYKRPPASVPKLQAKASA